VEAEVCAEFEGGPGGRHLALALRWWFQEGPRLPRLPRHWPGLAARFRGIWDGIWDDGKAGGSKVLLYGQSWLR
jgi:hypothetical protein